MPTAIVTQEVVEVLIDPQLPVYARLSQLVVEVLVYPEVTPPASTGILYACVI